MTPPHLNRAFASVVLCLAVAFIGLVLVRLLGTMAIHFEAPAQLALEKPAITTVLLLKRGVNIYSEQAINGPPYNLNMYTPAYHLLVSWLPEWPGHPYRMGRVVSAFFMIMAAATLVWRARSLSTIAVSGVLAAFFLSVVPVGTNTLFARQDPMGLFFSAASVCILAHPDRTRGRLFLAAAFAIIGMTAKQSFISAPLASLLFLVWTDRKSLPLYLGMLIVLGLGFVIAAHVTWGEGFWWSTLIVPSSSFRFANYRIIGATMAAQPSYVFFGAVALGALFTRIRWRASPFPLYFVVTLLWLLTFLPKEGAGTNYFFEPTLSGLLFLRQTIEELPDTGWARWIPGALMVGLAVAFAWDTFVIPPRAFAFSSRTSNETDAQYIVQLRAELAEVERRTGRPPAETVLVFPSLRNETISLGKVAVLSDPYLYSLLWRDGRLDRERLTQDIRNARVDVVVLPRGQRFGEGETAYFGPAFFRELEQRYRRALSGMHDYYVPGS